jgi:hypothetical protein
MFLWVSSALGITVGWCFDTLDTLILEVSVADLDGGVANHLEVHSSFIAIGEILSWQ